MESAERSPGRVLGDPISDSSTDSLDEQRRQIVLLDEEQGIYNHPEIDVPPRSDSEEDVSHHETPAVVKPSPRGSEGATPDPRLIPDAFPMGVLTDNRRSDEEHVDRREPFASNDEPADEIDIPEGRQFEYPSEPPPAYSSGDHTPEENPLIDDDDDVSASIQGNRFQASEGLGSGERSIIDAVATSGLVAAATTQAIMNGGGVRHPRIEDPISDDESEYSARGGVESIAPLGSEEKQLLHFIEAYTAESVPIEPVLKPFLLEYIPAIGDIDAFIKIPRPDEVEDNLGLTVLDEPAARQSDPTILGMQLRNETKDVIVSDAPVKKLERADKNVKEIEQWISNIKELHRTKPPDSVHYSKPMPDVEHLMQEWPSDVEELLRTEQLPSASLDVSLEEYVDICLSLLDIPVYRSRIQSLHVLFTLFSEFRNSQHFRNLAENNLMNNAFKENPTDRLELF